MIKEEESFFLKRFFVPLTDLKVIHFMVFIGILVFCNNLVNNFVWDDWVFIINNPLEHTLNIHSIFTQGNFNDIIFGFYRPIPALYFAIVYSLFQTNYFFYHLIQVVLQITDSILLFYLFKRFFNINLAFFLSCIFLIHPMQVESVSFISQTINPLFFLFGLTAMLASGKPETDKKRLIIIYSLLLLSCLTVETGILFVFMVIIYRALFTKSHRRDYVIGGIITILAYLWLRISIGHIFLASKSAQEVMVKLSPLARVIQIPSIIYYYIKTFFYPNPLIIDQEWKVTNITFHSFYYPLIIDTLVFGLALCFALYLYKTRKKTFLPFIFFSLWFLFGLSIIIQIIPLELTVADHFFYFPMVGLLGMLGILLQTISINKSFNNILITSALIVIIALSLRTIQRNTNWHDEITLYEHDIPLLKQQQSISAIHLEHDLITFLVIANRVDEAQYYALDYVKYNPGADQYNTLGIIYADKKEYSKAEYWFKKAVLNGASATAYQNLCRLYLIENKYVQARNTAIVGLTKYPHDHMLIVELQFVQTQIKQTVSSK